MLRNLTPVLALVGAALVGSPGEAARIVMGDGTPSFFLTDTTPDPANASNQAFYGNILGSGTSVGIFSETELGAAAETLEFYNTLTGVSAAFFSDPTDSTTLDNFDMVAIINPSRTLTALEAAALSAFEGAGGTLFLIADPASNVANTVPRLNTLLSDLGSALVLNTPGADLGTNSASGGAIDPTTLTVGVTDFNYGLASAISGGGTPLLRLQSGAPFAVYDGPASDIAIVPPDPQIPPVPLPATAWMLLAGIGALGLHGARRRR